MKKILFFFLLILVQSFSDISADTKTLSLGCTSEINEKSLYSYEKIKITKIEIDIDNYRNWTVNSIKIITSNSRYIEDIYKKRFKAQITVHFEDGSRCFFSGRVRHSGDQKDHISLHDNHILQSIDVHLDYGNIRGITKFKLLRPKTRGVLEDVLIQNQILRNLDYLAPRSIKLNARINKASSIMLFQEKASKELLEFNNRREGPILEANEKYFWKAIKDLPDNQLSNWSIGVVPLMNKSAKHILAKLTNTNLINKNENFKNICYDALSKLNLIYLYYANRFQDKKNNFNHWEYDLDNELLGLFNKKNIDKLNVYNLLLHSTNSYHGLAANNRKFYWNAFENYFEPIHYDANPNIEANLSSGNYRLPISKNFFNSFEVLEKKINNIEIDEFIKRLSSSGLDLSKKNLQLKLNKILINLSFVKENYEKFAKLEQINYNRFQPIENISEIFYKNIRDADPNSFIIKHKESNNTWLRCSIANQKCEDFTLTNKNIANLLEGDLELNGSAYQYLGKNLQLENLGNLNGYKKTKFNNSDIFYEDGVRILINEDENIINIFQDKPGRRVFFNNGELVNLKINFNGFNIREDNKFDLKIFPPNYPIDKKALTGCLTFANLAVSKISIYANNSSCEDTVNFVNVTGEIDLVSATNSFSDALDVDFSELKINEIKIISALNDCTDFSSGNYILGSLTLKNCGDKALSVGEKSFITLKKINATNANLGIASKDSSVVKADEVNLDNLETCVAAYNKKPEYRGGFIDIKKMSCKNYLKKADIDNNSKILEKNIILTNDIYGNKYDPRKLKITEVNGKEVIKNFHRDYKTFNKDKSVNVVIEIPAGMNEKWEVSKSDTGSLNREFYMGKPRSINKEPYPVNYGIVPNTVLPLNIGGDGDPLDAIVLGPPLTQGDIIKVKILGMIRMKDFGEIDDKIVAVPVNDNFSKFENLLHLKSKHPLMLNKIKDWFETYKGKNVVKFKNFGSVGDANELIKYTNNYYKKNGLKPRS
jgi:inorganic pyrophosphatase